MEAIGTWLLLFISTGLFVSNAQTYTGSVFRSPITACTMDFVVIQPELLQPSHSGTVYLTNSKRLKLLARKCSAT